MSQLPTIVSLLFVLITFGTLIYFYWIVNNSTSEKTRGNSLKILVGLIGWLILQFFLTIQGIYSDYPESLPPKIALFGIVPTFVFILGLFLTKKGKRFIDSLPLKQLTYLSLIRIPVELVLFSLALYETIPAIMSFEGLNFDILAGLTAPFIAYYGFTKNKFGNSWILAWNVISLLLLITIIIISTLSAPSPFQQFNFEGLEFAIFCFPFSWLPTFVVPVVLFSHFVSIRQLMKSNEK